MPRSKVLAIVAALSFPSAALAQAFDFEGSGISAFTSGGWTIGSQTLTFSPVGGGFLFLDTPFVALLGSISMTANSQNPRQFGFGLPMRFAFSNPIADITFAFGDAGGDDDSPARIQAFDASDNLLGVFDTPYPANKADGATRTLSFSGVGASYFLLSSGTVGGFNPNSIFWEITASTPVAITPEPATVALVGAGLLFVGVIYRRRSSRL